MSTDLRPPRNRLNYLDPAQAAAEIDQAAGKIRPRRKAHDWTDDTPVSREQAQAAQKAQRPADPRRPALARRQRPLKPEELAQVAELSRAGLVRSAEEQERRRSGMDRRMLQRGQPWLPPPPDEAA